MQNYTIVEWLFFFYFYCFVGWVFESTFVSIQHKKLVNRGFMRGPFLPIYGCGAIMMLVVSMPFQDNIILTYLAGCVGATALEFVTGVLMESLFKVRYWDYSNQKFNYKGHICLSSTIVWGFFTILMTRFLHKIVEGFYSTIPAGIVRVVVIVVSVLIVADFSLSFKAAINLCSVLDGLDKAKEEMERIQKRLDVLIAVANDSLESTKLTGAGYIETMVNGIESRFSNIKERLKINPGEFLDERKEEIMELREKYLVQKDRRKQFKRLQDFFQRDMIKNNPTMKSTRFADALEELKKAAADRKINNTGRHDNK